MKIISESTDDDVKPLTNLEEQVLRSCLNLGKLLVLYEFFVNLKEQPPEYSSVVSVSPSTSFDNDVSWLIISFVNVYNKKKKNYGISWNLW